jgi:hypothetical protein
VRFVALVCSLFLICTPALGQLISPGELTEGHSSLEGLSNCTSCHNLGRRGIVPTKCLDCHKPLSTRIQAKIGYHSTVATEDCGTCHKEHFGKTFDSIRFDTTSFDHTDAGFELLASHADVNCSNCHTEQNITDEGVRRFKGEAGALNDTYLGLNPLCATCHADTSPHVGQFIQRDCAACHDENEWEDAVRFEHQETAFPLLGKHANVTCSSCHDSATSNGGDLYAIYAPVPFGDCGTCHEDPHSPSLGSNCSTCHSENGFSAIKTIAFEKTFRHETTGFELIGRHASIQCASCHSKNNRNKTVDITFTAATTRKTYPSPVVDDCESCHVDYHEDTFAELDGGTVCSSCHSQTAWAPPSFDLERHNLQTDFKLVGAHQATPCVLCHGGKRSTQNEHPFKFENTECQTCHLDDSIHGSELSKTVSCSTCHMEDSWLELVEFDHSSTEFPLVGKHAQAQCVDCHARETENDLSLINFSTISDTCIDCHTSDSPHQEQFESVSCNSCHNELTFTISDFDHDTSRFPLSPAHQGVACIACHLKEDSPAGVFTRFKPVTTRCEDCH